MILREIAHARAGDKGDISNISVIAFDMADYLRIAEFLTADRVIACSATRMGSPTRATHRR